MRKTLSTRVETMSSFSPLATTNASVVLMKQIPTTTNCVICLDRGLFGASVSENARDGHPGAAKRSAVSGYTILLTLIVVITGSEATGVLPAPLCTFY